MYNMMSAYQGGPVLLSVETQDVSQTYPQPFAVQENGRAYLSST